MRPERQVPPPAEEPNAEIDLADWERLVMKLARRYGANKRAVRDSEEYADGQIGLLAARRSFDPSRGVTFMTWAFPWVKHAIINGQRRRKFGPKDGPGPRLFPFSRLDARDHSGERDFAAELADDSPAEPVAERELAALLMRSLDPRELRLVRRYAMEDWTLEEVGAAESPPITREWVRQIVERALARMRRRANGSLGPESLPG